MPVASLSNSISEILNFADLDWSSFPREESEVNKDALRLFLTHRFFETGRMNEGDYHIAVDACCTRYVTISEKILKSLITFFEERFPINCDESISVFVGSV